MFISFGFAIEIKSTDEILDEHYGFSSIEELKSDEDFEYALSKPEVRIVIFSMDLEGIKEMEVINA